MEDKGYLDSLGEPLWKYAQKVWERNWMNLDMSTMLLDTKPLNATLLNMYNPRSVETIQKLRELSKEDDQMKSAAAITGSVRETLLDREAILKERGGFWEGHAREYPLKIGC